jgi:Fe-S cluster biogenesis protein NfuA
VDGTDIRAIGQRIEALVHDLGRISDPRDRERADELVRLLLELYGAGLARIMDIVMEGEARGLGERLAQDPLVASLLLLHNLHPDDTETRVLRVLDRIGPQLAAHGGRATLVGIDDGRVRVRLEATGSGCGSSGPAMKLAVEEAIEEIAPELRGIDIDDVAPSPRETPLIQIEVRPRRPALTRAGAPSDDVVAVQDRPGLSPGAVPGLGRTHKEPEVT